MKVYLSVDMEGVAGVVHEDQTNPVDPRCADEYARFRRLMTQEANAAIAGAFDGGATRVLVNDRHWTMRNLLAEELDRRAALISGAPKPWSMMEGIDLGWDLAAFIGYHAKAGTPEAILDHTYTDRITDVRLGGTSVGEVGLNAAVAGAFGVPVALVSGDQALKRETRALLGEGVACVEVKVALSRTAAQSVAPAVAGLMIRQAMRDVVAARKNNEGPPLAPFCPAGPHVLEVDFTSAEHADHCALTPGTERQGPATLAIRHADYREAFRTFCRMLATRPD